MITKTRPSCDPAGLYSIKDAANFLGVSKTTIHRWICNGAINFKCRKANRVLTTSGSQIIRCWESAYLGKF